MWTDLCVYHCSLSFTGKVARGTQKYVCNSGTWTKTGSSADMLSESGAKLGTYWSTNNNGALTYFWTVVNSAGVSSETGQASSSLQGNYVVLDYSSYVEFVLCVIPSGSCVLLLFVFLVLRM